jgi:alpha-amylase/alpha-mannosidase (GH57 family)
MTDEHHRHLCIHGHFYQPPRDDPFTHLVPDEPGAAPYHNFNEKITTECYRANAEVGNFEHMSFDLGPTLAQWLARYAPDVYLRIVESDRLHRMRHGVGNALAHAYNHTILPLATSRDKRTQIAWGIADFRHRFGHMPQGMWLAETAVDYETLEIMADLGVEFTVLAPWQAAQGIDVTEPYWVRLSGDRRIAVFFYNGPLSGDVSFKDDATANADAFAAGYLPHQVNWEKEQRGEDQIITIATDGELYGHHKPFRDRFLAHLMRHSAPAFGYEIVTLGRYLREHPPQHEVQIHTPSAWSCFHGVARWSAGCGCTEGDTSWKPALRRAIDRLGARIDMLFEQKAALTLADPWQARDNYIAWRNGWMKAEDFWARYGRNGKKPHKEALAVRTWHMLEAQYCLQAAYTSCGWFFEDLDRIEPRNDVNSARCAISHMWQALHIDLQGDFVDDLKAARSWRTQLTGDMLYMQLPTPPNPDLLPPIMRSVRKEPAA